MTEDDNDEFNITTESDGDDDAPLSDIAMGNSISRKRNKRNKIIIILSIILVVIMIVSGSIWVYITNRNNNDDSSSSVRTRSSYGVTSNGSSDGTSSSAASTLMMKYDIPDYYQKSHSDMTKSERENADAVALSLAPSNIMTSLPSESLNPSLTDDESKAYNSDGTFNTNYSYLTAENVSSQVMDDIERIINPIYGNWSDLQKSNTINRIAYPIDVFNDMFAPDYIDSVSTATTATAQGILPLVADWDANDYNGAYKNHALYSSIIGTMRSLSCDYAIKGTTDDRITCTADITYHVPLDDSSTTDISKNLIITYQPNYDLSDSSRRILIDSVKQD